MKKQEDLNGILLAVTCLIAGLISPSNGVDSAKAIPPDELLKRVSVIVVSAVLIFVILKLFKVFNITSKNNYK